MLEVATAKSHKVLFLNTLAFTVCFAAWMFNGVLVTFLADNQVFDWGPIEIGWLMGIPVLTGSIFRLPAFRCRSMALRSSSILNLLSFASALGRNRPPCDGVADSG